MHRGFLFVGLILLIACTAGVAYSLKDWIEPLIEVADLASRSTSTSPSTSATVSPTASTVAPATESLQGIAAALEGRLVQLHDGSLQPYDCSQLAKVRYWAFYFSGSNLCAGQSLNQEVIDFYDKITAENHPDFALIYVPMDPDESIMLEGMKTQKMYWPTVIWSREHVSPLDLTQFEFGQHYASHLVLVDQNGSLLADSMHDVHVNPFDHDTVFQEIREFVH